MRKNPPPSLVIAVHKDLTPWFEEMTPGSVQRKGYYPEYGYFTYHGDESLVKAFIVMLMRVAKSNRLTIQQAPVVTSKRGIKEYRISVMP